MAKEQQVAIFALDSRGFYDFRAVLSVPHRVHALSVFKEWLMLNGLEGETYQLLKPYCGGQVRETTVRVVEVD